MITDWQRYARSPYDLDTMALVAVLPSWQLLPETVELRGRAARLWQPLSSFLWLVADHTGPEAEEEAA